MDVYVRLVDAPVARSRELPEALGGMVLDFAEDGQVVGIEVLGAIGADINGVAAQVLRLTAD